MFMPQERQRPRSRNQLSTGMLSYGAMRDSQPGHIELGQKIDLSCGQRMLSTFRNEPIETPMIAADRGTNQRSTSGSISTSTKWASAGERVEEDRARDGGVERLGAAGHRNLEHERRR